MSYKLYYFDLEGRGEPIRMLFALAKVKFTDNRIKMEDWPALKPTFKFGQLPILRVGDKELTQSTTILRFLARKFKLAGANEWEATLCDEIGDAINDLIAECFKFMFYTTDETQKEEARLALLKIHIPKYLGKFNTVQHENGGTFLVGKEVTWADIYMVNVLKTIEGNVDKGVLNGYPHLRKLSEAVFAIPEIKSYIDKRPK